MRAKIYSIHTPLQRMNKYSGISRVGYRQRDLEVNEEKPAREQVKRQPARGRSEGSVSDNFSLPIRLKDHPLHAFIDGLFYEHEQQEDTNLFPFGENQAREWWAAGRTEAS